MHIGLTLPRKTSWPLERAGHTRLAFLDGWRGLAILCVLAGHAASGVSVLGQFSTFGVDLFFALSGRLMADLLILRQQSIPVFLIRRFSRIVPALFVYIGLILCITEVANLLTGGHTEIAISAAAAAIFVHNYLPTADVNLAFEHCWSLAVEEHSYLALAALAALSARRRGIFIWVATGITLFATLNGFALQHHVNAASQSVMWRSDVRAGSIFVSAAIYLMIVGAQRKRMPRWVCAVSPVSAALAVIAFALPGMRPSLNLALTSSLLALSVATLDHAHPALLSLLKSRLLTSCGILSYSLYLWQQPFLISARESTMPGASLLALGATVVMALWSYHRIERPARLYLNARITRVHEVPAALAV